MKSRACILISCFLVAILVAVPRPSERMQGASGTVLVLNSYHEGCSRTDEEVAGIRQALDSVFPSVNICIEYLDWQRCPTQENALRFEDLLATRYGTVRPSVLVVTDDQGYGDLGCHGNPVLRTPHMDHLQAESVRCTNFHVGPTCAPTRCTT